MARVSVNEAPKSRGIAPRNLSEQLKRALEFQLRHGHLGGDELHLGFVRESLQSVVAGQTRIVEITRGKRMRRSVEPLLRGGGPLGALLGVRGLRQRALLTLSNGACPSGGNDDR